MIYLAKGNSRSALIDMESGEVRTIPNKDLNLSDEEPNEVEQRIFLHGVNCFDYELMDVHFNEVPTSEELKSYLPKLPGAYNIRIFIKDQPESATNEVLQSIRIISEHVYHAGMVLIADDVKLRETIEKECNWVKVLEMSAQSDSTYHQPVFLPTPYAIKLARKSNLFHHGRVTVSFKNSTVSIDDHRPYDIPKHEIAVCKACEFREICYDARIPVIQDQNYFYETECAYDPIAGKWNE